MVPNLIENADQASVPKVVSLSEELCANLNNGCIGLGGEEGRDPLAVVGIEACANRTERPAGLEVSDFDGSEEAPGCRGGS